MCKPKWFGCCSKCFWDDPAEAWRILYDVLYRRARYRGVPDQDAQNLVSETIDEHRRRFPARPEGSDPVAYAMGILQNGIADWYKDCYRQPPTSGLESLETSVFHQMERLHAYREEEEKKDRAELFAIVQEVLATLSKQDRQIIDLYFLEELAFPEVAKVLGEPMEKVKSRYYRTLLPHIQKEVLEKIR